MAEDVIRSHWHHSIPGLSIVPTEFYEAVSQAILKKNIPGVKLTSNNFAEGPIGSAQRLYLRAKRNEYHFDICGAPFADGSFVSWWLIEEAGCAKGCLSVIPLLGSMLLALFFRQTYYTIDTRLMFEGAIHDAILQVIDGLTKANGLRMLEGDERKPEMRKLLG